MLTGQHTVGNICDLVTHTIFVSALVYWTVSRTKSNAAAALSLGQA